MINLLGEKGHMGTAIYGGLSDLLDHDNVFPHLYGKEQTKPFRKMGHVTITGKTLKEVKETAEKIKDIIQETIGLTPDDLPERHTRANGRFTKSQGRTQAKAVELQGEISRFYERTGKGQYGEVSREMETEKTGESLAELSARALEPAAAEQMGHEMEVHLTLLPLRVVLFVQLLARVHACLVASLGGFREAVDRAARTAVADAVCEVWASLFTTRAVGSRAAAGVGANGAPRRRPWPISKEVPSGTITDPPSPPSPEYAAPPSVRSSPACTPMGASRPMSRAAV